MKQSSLSPQIWTSLTSLEKLPHKYFCEKISLQNICQIYWISSEWSCLSFFTLLNVSNRNFISHSKLLNLVFVMFMPLSQGQEVEFHEVEIPLFHEINIFLKKLHNCSGDRKGLRDPRGSLFKGFFLGLGVSICLDMVSIETLDLDSFKSWSRPSRKSRQVLKTGLDAKDVLDSSKNEVSTWLMP